MYNNKFIGLILELWILRVSIRQAIWNSRVFPDQIFFLQPIWDRNRNLNIM